MRHQDCEVKLADFGHSKVVDDIFISSRNVGTPLFMAPEAFRTKALTSSDSFDERAADLWSLGVCLGR